MGSDEEHALEAVTERAQCGNETLTKVFTKGSITANARFGGEGGPRAVRDKNNIF